MPAVTSATILYKHMERRWAEELIRKRKFRIGTLDSFRNSAPLHESIGDGDEGNTLRAFYAPHEQYELTGEELEFGKRVMRVRGDIKMVGLSFIECVKWPNAFVYCLTRNRVLGGDFDPKYDAVVAIRDVPRFAAALTMALAHEFPVISIRSKIVQATIRDVQYRDREMDWRAEPLKEPYLVKPLKYAPQQEVRIIWHIPLGKMDPIMVESREAASLCRIVS